MAFKHRGNFERAQSEMNLMNWPAAIHELNEIIEKDPSHSEALLHRGYANLRNADLESARIDIEKALSLRSENGIIWLVKGELHLLEKKWEEACRAFQKAVEIEPDNGRALYLLGKALVHLGRTLDAADFFERALQFDRDFVQAQLLCELVGQKDR